MRVTVGNGEALSCGGECTGVSLMMAGVVFTVDLILLPIYGVDLVLGVQWMLKLGPVLFYYTNLWMEFDFNGQRIRLHGLTQPQFTQIRAATLTKSDTDLMQMYQLTVEPIQSQHDQQFGSDAPNYIATQL